MRAEDELRYIDRYTTSTHTHTQKKRKKMGVTGERVVRYKLPGCGEF